MARIPIGETLKSVAKEGIKGAVRSGGVRIPKGETLKGRKPPPGATWMNPLQEQHPDVNRAFVMNFEAASPETMGRALAKDFEVKHRGGLDFSIRKPGEKKWKVVDPDTWLDMLPFIGGDWSDIAGDAATGLGSMVGALITSPGVVTSAAGAAGGAAAVETAKQALGKLLGSSVTAGEAAKSVAFEGVLGAGGEVAAAAAKPLLGALAKGGRKALLGNVEEVGARNLVAQEVAAKEAAMGAGPIAAQMETPTEGVLSKFKTRGAKAADELSLVETEGVGEMLDAPAGELRSRAAQKGIKLNEPVNVSVAKEALEKQASQEAKEISLEISRAKALQDTKRRIPAKLIQEMEAATPDLTKLKPRARNVAIRKALLEGISGMEEQLAKRQAGISHGQAVKFKMLLDEGNPEALKAFSDLGKTLPETEPGKLAQKLFQEQTTPAQRSAVDRQVERRLQELGDYEPMDIDHILRRESEELGLAPGKLRTYTGTKVPEINEQAFKEAMDEVEGMTLDEAQAHLQQAGWKGDIPHSIDEVADRLYARQHLGLSGSGKQPTPTEGYFGEYFDPLGEKTKWHEGGLTDVTEIRAGGETTRFGQEAVKPSGLRDMALAARPVARGAGKALEGVGKVMTAPARGIAAAVRGAMPEGAGILTDYIARRPQMAAIGAMSAGMLGAPGGGALAALGAADIIGRGIQKLGHSLAADHSGQALMKLVSSAPAHLTEKMMKPLERLAEAGPWAYRSGMYTLMHDADVREWIEGQDKIEAEG